MIHPGLFNSNEINKGQVHSSVMVSTTPTLEGYRIVSYHGIVVAQGEFTGSDRFGTVHQDLLSELARIADVRDANAVVGISMAVFSYTQYRGNLVLQGTAVKVERL